MRVLIDTTYSGRGPTGTGVYLERLIPALRALGVDVVAVADARRGPPGGGGLRSLRNLMADRLWNAVTLPRLARESNAEVLHHPLPAAVRNAGCPQVVTVHDLAFERLPGHFDRRWRAYARRVHRNAARRAGVVIAVSNTTAADVRARWGVPADRIVVAPHGPGQMQDGAASPVEPSHFLYVGDDEPRKNLALLQAAHRLYRERMGESALPLVLAGSAGDRRPDADGLAELYRGAAALVHPALHEGFGLTPLEAMAAGTPVIAARSPGVVEVCEDAALYVDPRDPVALAVTLMRVAGDASLRRDLAARGRRRAGAFSWESSARRHVEAYTLAARDRA